MSSASGQHKIQVVSGSLAATCFVGFTQIVSRGGELSQSLHAAIFFFALGIPPLVAIVVSEINTPEQTTRAERALPALLASWMLALVGIGCMFANYGYTYLTAYMVSIAAALVLMRVISGDNRDKPNSAKTSPSADAS